MNNYVFYADGKIYSVIEAKSLTSAVRQFEYESGVYYVDEYQNDTVKCTRKIRTYKTGAFKTLSRTDEP